jgi:hypothetical protein
MLFKLLDMGIYYTKFMNNIEFRYVYPAAMQFPAFFVSF